LKGFLLDENLPGQMAIMPSLPVFRATDLGASPADGDLWRFAREKSLVVVTKDADFSDRIFVETPPPWIVHLRVGNLRRRDYHAFMTLVWPRIEAHLPASKLVCVYRDRIEAFS
jgi:predicted nuclease of predicted toxin-antitoxin system